MGRTQAKPFILVLLSIHLFILVSGRPAVVLEPQQVCDINKYSAYFLEIYKNLYSRQEELIAIDCDEEFNDQLINPAFCECDSISGKSAEPQGEPETATGVSAATLFANT